METQIDSGARPDGGARPDSAAHAAAHAQAQADAVRALDKHVRDVPDFPKPGIVFKDITPVLSNPSAFAAVIAALTSTARTLDVTMIAGIEARGFLLAAPVAVELGLGLLPVRKQGKLPGKTVAQTYDLEYGTATLEIHADACGPSDRVLLVDDVLATGGTAAAAHNLVRHTGAVVAGLAVLMELGFLSGRGRVAPLEVLTLLTI